MFGDSTADYTPSSIDSAVSFSPALSAAYAGLSALPVSWIPWTFPRFLTTSVTFWTPAQKPVMIRSRFSRIPFG